MDMIFIPFERIGDFYLDDEVSKYKNILSKYIHVPKDEYGYEYYHVNEPYTDKDSHFIAVTNNKIRAVFCYDNVVFNGINLIGLTIDEFKKITNSDYIGEPDELDIFEDEPPMYDYKFKEIGVTVETHYERINNITVSGHWSYEDD